ncbi:ComF family protein, partial [Curtobacterium sp. CT11-45]
MTTRDSLRPWLDAAVAVLGLFLPVDCVGCGRPDRALCAACRHALDAMPRRVRLVAGVRLDAAFEYTGLVRTMLLELKLRGRVDLARPLGARFGGLVRAALADAGPGAVLLRVPPSRQG